MTERIKLLCLSLLLRGQVCVCLCVCALPVFPAARLPWRFPSLRVLKHVHEDGLKLAENHSGNLKVALQSLHALPEVLREVGHVSPLPHLREELDQTGRTDRSVINNRTLPLKKCRQGICRFQKYPLNTLKCSNATWKKARCF